MKNDSIEKDVSFNLRVGMKCEESTLSIPTTSPFSDLSYQTTQNAVSQTWSSVNDLVKINAFDCGDYQLDWFMKKNGGAKQAIDTSTFTVSVTELSVETSDSTSSGNYEISYTIGLKDHPTVTKATSEADPLIVTITDHCLQATVSVSSQVDPADYSYTSTTTFTASYKSICSIVYSCSMPGSVNLCSFFDQRTGKFSFTQKDKTAYPPDIYAIEITGTVQGYTNFASHTFNLKIVAPLLKCKLKKVQLDGSDDDSISADQNQECDDLSELQGEQGEDTIQSQDGQTFKFDMTQQFAAPITCSIKDALWSMPLLPLLNAKKNNIKIQMETVSNIFTFDQEESTVFINNESRKQLFSGKICPSSKLVFLEFSLKIDKQEIENQKLPIAILRDEQNQLQLVDVEETQKLKVVDSTINQVGELKIKFNRPILDLPIDTNVNEQGLRLLGQFGYKIDDILRVRIKDAEEFDETDKSIKSVTYQQKDSENSQELTVVVTFNENSAISSDILEPDVLILELLKPKLIVDAQTYEPIEQKELEIKIGPQMTLAQQQKLNEMIEAAARIGVGLSVWQIVLCLVINKTINKMWILFNATQFLVFIGLWQINYSSRIIALFKETKRVFLGEYIDDLEIGQKVSNLFGIQSNQNDEQVAIGEDRLGSNEIASNFGITQIIAIFVICLLAVLIFVAIIIGRRIGFSEKNKERIQKFKQSIFYNPMIRFVFLSSLKLNFSSIVVFKDEKSSLDQLLIAALILTFISIAIPIVLAWVLYKHRESLHQESKVKTIGTMYLGRRVVNTLDERNVWIYPITFFCRRTTFIAATVFLFEYPNMQMLVHQSLTLANLVYISIDNRMFADKCTRFIEIISEILLLLVSVLLQQFLRYYSLDDVTNVVELSIFSSLGLLVLLNTIYLVYSIVIDCKESRRTKAIKAAKQAYEEAVKVINDKKLLQLESSKTKPLAILLESSNTQPLVVLQKASLSVVKEEDEDEDEKDSSKSSKDNNLSISSIGSSTSQKIPVPTKDLIFVRKAQSIALKSKDIMPNTTINQLKKAKTVLIGVANTPNGDLSEINPEFQEQEEPLRLSTDHLNRIEEEINREVDQHTSWKFHPMRVAKQKEPRHKSADSDESENSSSFSDRQVQEAIAASLEESKKQQEPESSLFISDSSLMSLNYEIKEEDPNQLEEEEKVPRIDSDKQHINIEDQVLESIEQTLQKFHRIELHNLKEKEQQHTFQRVQNRDNKVPSNSTVIQKSDNKVKQPNHPQFHDANQPVSSYQVPPTPGPWRECTKVHTEEQPKKKQIYQPPPSFSANFPIAAQALRDFGNRDFFNKKNNAEKGNEEEKNLDLESLN